MLGFEFFNARHGDAFLVRWGDRVMLVDGGPSGLYEATLRDELLARLPRLPDGTPHVDTVLLSHVDDDHAAGIVRLLDEIRRARREQLPDPLTVRRLWFNAVEELVEVVDPALTASVQPLLDAAMSERAVAASYHQGRAVRDGAAALGLSGNQPFESPLVCRAVADLSGLAVTVVAPDQAAIDALATKWRTAQKQQDPAVLTASYADRSIPNLSSIVIHLEHQGRTALLTGDARGDRIVAGLEESGLLSAGGVLHVDLLKLPHHGSNKNMEPEFFQRVVADHYVISADGIKHHHPSEETLDALVESRAATDDFTIHLTNDIGFATGRLEGLRLGRAFSIRTRGPLEGAIRVDLS
jgi:beta-lactamase superfamily II metal-dependent hydrolase